MGEKIKFKFLEIRAFKVSFIFAIFGLLLGFILGAIWFFLVKFSAESYDLSNVPLSGLFFLSFIIIPLIVSLLAMFLGWLNCLILNLSLKLIKGLDVKVQEE